MPATTFTAAAIVTAITWYGTVGLIGHVASLSYLAPLAAAAYVYCLAWHLRSRRKVPYGRFGVQANKDLVRGTPGLAYFGGLLGPGILTEMSTPLVWAGVAFAAVVGPWAALLYGVGFGLGRSSTALAGIVLGPRLTDYSGVAVFVAGSLRRRLRPVGVAAAVIGFGLALDPVAVMLMTATR